MTYHSAVNIIWQSSLPSLNFACGVIEIISQWYRRTSLLVMFISWSFLSNRSLFLPPPHSPCFPSDWWVNRTTRIFLIYILDVNFAISEDLKQVQHIVTLRTHIVMETMGFYTVPIISYNADNKISCLVETAYHPGYNNILLNLVK